MGQCLLPRVGISMGDPAGVGPEVILKALKNREVSERCLPVVIGDYNLLLKTARELALDHKLTVMEHDGEAERAGETAVISLSSLENIKRGEVSEEAGRASGMYIKKGVELALEGALDALVTAPINKESFNRGGFHYPGHTEFLAELTGTSDFAMMLMGASLKVVLLTIHCPLMEVAGKLTAADTLRIIRLSDRSLRGSFGIKRPRIALASLNPHAGEGGLFGVEERDILIPAVQAARAEGIDVTDPMPSDTLFYKAARGGFDVVVCPYHDQGLIPLKLLHFDDGVNVTLGLPIVRTSPDHGTAFDIAGKGIANPASLIAAIKTAVDMAEAAGKQPDI